MVLREIPQRSCGHYRAGKGGTPGTEGAHNRIRGAWSLLTPLKELNILKGLTSGQL